MLRLLSQSEQKEVRVKDSFSPFAGQNPLQYNPYTEPLWRAAIEQYNRAMAPAEQKQVIEEKAKRRDELQAEIRELSESRNQYIKEKVEAEGGADDSLDEKIYRAVKDQAASVGLSYDSDSARY